MAQQSFRLADAHRLAQAGIGTETLLLAQRLFPLLDLTNLDRTTTRWLRAMVPVIQAQSSKSARLAADYLTVARQLDLGDDPQFVPTLARTDVAQIVSSLSVTGPVRVNALMADGAGMATIRRTVLTTSSRSAMRLAMAGGRGTITETINADPHPAGWARVTSGRPCAFCAMLASRGPVYTGQASASFQAHDGCACSAMAVYDRRDGLTPQADDFSDLWHTVTPGLSGKDALNAFRRALESSAALPAVA